MERSRTIAALAVLLAAGHFLWLSSWVVPAYSGPDADGYFTLARLLAFEGKVTFMPETPAQHLGLHWLEKPNGEYVCRYPAGLSVLLGGVWKTLGRDAAFYLSPLLASLTVLALFGWARRWVGDGPALAIAGVQASNAASNFHALHSDSHTATAFFLVSGLAALDRWELSGRRLLSFAAGLLLGMVPATRYAEVGAGVGVAAFLFFQLRRPERRGQIPFAVAGAAIPVGLTMLYNHVQFGAFWETAYSLTGEAELSWEYFWRNWPVYVDLLSTSGVGLFFAIGLLGMGLMIARRETRPLGAALFGTVASVTCLYSVYYSEANGATGMRFVLPMLPLFLLPAVFLLRQAASGKTFAVLLIGLTVFQSVRGAIGTERNLFNERVLSERSHAVISWLETNSPAGSVVAAQRRINEQLHFTGRWKLAAGELLGLPQESFFEDDGGPTPEQEGKALTLRRRYLQAAPEERTELVLDDLRAWADGKPIYAVARRSHVPLLRADAEPVAEIKLPPLGDTRSLGILGMWKGPWDQLYPRFGILGETLVVLRIE